MPSKKLFLTITLLIVLVSFLFVGSVGASSEMWSQTYGGAEGDYAHSLVETSDGGFAIVGITRDDYGFDIDCLLVKTDEYGNMEWNQTYGGEDSYHADAVVQTSDGGYAIAGDKYVFDEGYDCWLAKTDEYGNMEWNQTYGGSSPDHARSLVETFDGGYALAGYTYSFGGKGYDFWLIKTDGYGNVEWNQTYGGANHEYARSLVETSDGGYALAGYSDDDGYGFYSDFWLVKTDAYGNMEWNQTYSEGLAFSVVETSDGGYALAGGTRLVKTDAHGSLEWYRTYDGGSANSLIEVSDGGYALAGYTTSFGAGSYDFWLAKTDEHGVIPEFPSWLILPLFLTVTLVVAIFRRKLSKTSNPAFILGA